MVDSIQGTNLIQQVKVKQNNAQAPKPNTSAPEIKPQQQNEVASSAASAASMAYAAPQVLVKDMTYDNFVDKLKASGKIEGKDYRINDEGKFTDVTLLTKDGKDGKVYVWKNVDGKKEYLGSEEYSYNKAGKKLSQYTLNAEGKIEAHSHYYYNDETDQAVISHDKFTYKTTPEEYKKSLTEKGTKFTEQTEKDKFGNEQHIIEEYDKDGKETIKTVWTKVTDGKGNDYVYRDLFNTDNTVGTSVYYDDEKAVVTNFFK